MSKCRVCPLRDGCYKENAKTKTYSITIKSTEHLDQATFQKAEAFKELAKERYKIEAKNSELKNRHGYKKSSSSGLFKHANPECNHYIRGKYKANIET
ncbi:hypothetical protein CR203_03490 [Salipaludibacillus neizhouensis]|uniref:Transposase DDE domain-containing protein n=1 Tax=Salipaludibacillus neizhouensis TaxID=885475 RepID=A0A3A9KNA0_9BACI|nr:transposase [Salipaludibacillus neizhouensis]RKL69405.1 hypothetical protein CR203_03490 [Salipaludibacillus neizhouensis]